MWQDPMNDSQQTETRKRITNILDALVSELKSRGMNVTRKDTNTLVIDGMTFTATDQLSDTYNDVCYLLTDYNQMIDCTLSRIDECADTIEGLLEVQVEKMEFNKMVQKQRSGELRKRGKAPTPSNWSEDERVRVCKYLDEYEGLSGDKALADAISEWLYPSSWD